MNRLWPVEYASIEVKEVIEVEESQEVLEVESTRSPEALRLRQAISRATVLNRRLSSTAKMLGSLGASFDTSRIGILLIFGQKLAIDILI